MNHTVKVLIVDDEAELRQSVASILKTSLTDLQFEISEAINGKQAVEMVQSDNFDMVLMDVKMPEMNGMDALVAIKEHDPQIFVVIMTAHANVQDAISAIKEGAYDYLEKPVQAARLSEIVRKSLEAKELVSSLALSNPIFDDDIDSEFVGRSQKMKEVFHLIFKLCKVDTTVLVRGENGTGKELVARAIHFNSPRKSGAFVALNCGAIPENLMESELFGHEKGAFTGAVERKIGRFQLANNGTLFLDEIAELKPELQVKLLRVLQEKKFTPVGGTREVKTNARIIAATNRNLEKMIEEGDLREDLFYRLNVMPIFLPPLRERKDDIGALAQHFIKKFSKSFESNIQALAPDALDILVNYNWPGNIRELENVIERAFILEPSNQITVSSLPDNMKKHLGTQTSAQSNSQGQNISGGAQTAEALVQSTGAIKNPASPGVAFDFESFKESSEKEFILNALKANNGRINQTVARANIPKNTLLRKIKKYGINVKDLAEHE